MFLSDDVLDSLTCSLCEQYLSIKPVKVYPNRQVKCGRCSEENDGGVVSPHYETVIKDLQFPCINRYEGCKVRLRCSEMEAHEELCPILPRCYICPICVAFDGTAFMMLAHFRNHHAKCVLKNKTHFTVDLDKDQELVYLYVARNSLQDSLAIVYFKYDQMLKQMVFNLHTFCQEQSKISSDYGFVLSSVDSEVKFQSPKIYCKPFQNNLNGEETKVEIDPSVYPKNVLQCLFFVEELTATIESESLQTCEVFSGSVKLRHTFKDVHEFETRSYSPKFEVCGVIWSFFISRDTDQNEREFLGLYLELNDCKKDPFCFKAGANFQLISNKFKKTKMQEGNFLFRYLGDAFGFKEFISFDRLVEQKNGFITQEGITVELDLTVAPYVEEKSFCKCDCKCCKKIFACSGKDSEEVT